MLRTLRRVLFDIPGNDPTSKRVSATSFEHASTTCLVADIQNVEDISFELHRHVVNMPTPLTVSNSHPFLALYGLDRPMSLASLWRYAF